PRDAARHDGERGRGGARRPEPCRAARGAGVRHRPCGGNAPRGRASRDLRGRWRPPLRLPRRARRRGRVPPGGRRPVGRGQGRGRRRERPLARRGALARERPPAPLRGGRRDPRRRQPLRAEIAASMTLEPNASILTSLRAGTPEDAIVVAGMTQIGYYSRPFWPVYQPRTYLTSSYSGNLGYEYPTALGAKVACPKRPVVAICGDGGFLYNAQELATAVLHRISIVAVVFNDNAYGNVARDLDEAWGGSYAAALSNPDFMKLADAYGVVGMRANDPTDVGALVRDAIQLDRPVLIEVPVARMARPPFFAPLRAPAKYTR